MQRSKEDKMKECKCPCKKCDKREECPVEYLCDELLIWAYTEGREE